MAGTPGRATWSKDGPQASKRGGAQRPLRSRVVGTCRRPPSWNAPAACASRPAPAPPGTAPLPNRQGCLCDGQPHCHPSGLFVAPGLVLSHGQSTNTTIAPGCAGMKAGSSRNMNTPVSARAETATADYGRCEATRAMGRGWPRNIAGGSGHWLAGRSCAGLRPSNRTSPRLRRAAHRRHARLDGPGSSKSCGPEFEGAAGMFASSPPPKN